MSVEVNDGDDDPGLLQVHAAVHTAGLGNKTTTEI